MRLALSDDIKVFVSLEFIDMRKSINGLSALVLDVFDHDPVCQHIFVFRNKAKDKVKLLFWDKNGFVLCYKRLSKGKFKFKDSQGKLQITHEQLAWLLAGLDFQLMGEFNELNYSAIY